jgi:hypothetical protein
MQVACNTPTITVQLLAQKVHSPRLHDSFLSGRLRQILLTVIAPRVSALKPGVSGDVAFAVGATKNVKWAALLSCTNVMSGSLHHKIGLKQQPDHNRHKKFLKIF